MFQQFVVFFKCWAWCLCLFIAPSATI